MADLETTAMVVDGWTEDFHFPNLSWTDHIKSGTPYPNPNQFRVRKKVAQVLIEELGQHLL